MSRVDCLKGFWFINPEWKDIDYRCVIRMQWCKMDLHIYGMSAKIEHTNI